MILLSPGGDNVHRSTLPDDTLLVGTVDGIALLQRSPHGEWRLVSRALQGCFVSALTRLASGTIVAGTHGIGIAKSDDHGRSWTWSNAGLTQFDIWAVKAVRLGGRERIFAGTMPAHLYVSDDNAATWAEQTALRTAPSAPLWYFPPPPRLGHVKDIAAQGDTLLVGIEVGALLQSKDGGNSFAELPVDDDPTGIDMHRIIVHRDRPDRLIAATGLGMMTSDDRGGTWRRGPNPPGMDYPDPAVVHPDDPDLLFVAGGVGWPPQWYRLGRAQGKIARSRDGGASWEGLLGGLPAGQRPIFGAMTLAAWDRGFAVLAADTDGQIFESRDGGDAWQVVAETAPVSKGDFYKGLAKGRPPLANVDDLAFSGKMEWMGAAEADR